MSFFVHVVHTVRPISSEVFDRWVDFYTSTAVPAMQRSGWHMVGAWKRSTGRLQEDLILARFDSLAAFERASASLRTELAKGPRLSDVLGTVEVSEEVTFAYSMPYATEQRLTKALSHKAAKPRQYLESTLTVKTGGLLAAYEALSEAVEQEEHAGSKQLVTAYESRSGLRGTVRHIWVLPGGVPDLSYRRSDGGTGRIEPKLSEVVPDEQLTYLNPLPYSPSQ